ncbi:MAG: hypothetical protein LBD23_04325 [Oscillospiraceae bacterium]|nr:hypothetical protein [Oscillospiraceae bacterium]
MGAFSRFLKCSIADNVQGIRRFDGTSRITVPHNLKPSKCGGAKLRLTTICSFLICRGFAEPKPSADGAAYTVCYKQYGRLA